ncbi:MAG TPA: hypothetical protein DCE41_20200 [Cytophagales bacterium]|nr:hypothetical protein [Cytophagales bacterium]
METLKKTPTNSADKTFSFRQITDEQELEQFMKLRLEIYADSKFKNLIQYPVDIDTYDLHSLPFGLFCDGEPAGFIRVILPRQDYYNPQAFRIGKKYSAFHEETHSEAALRGQSGPSVHVFKWIEGSEVLKEYYAEAQQQGLELMEGSRIILFKKFRGLKAARFLTECTITTYVEHCIKAKRHAIIVMAAKQHRFYEQYGFQVVEQEAYSALDRDHAYCVMALPYAETFDASPIADRFRGEVMQAYQEFCTTGQITRQIPMTHPTPATSIEAAAA